MKTYAQNGRFMVLSYIMHTLKTCKAGNFSKLTWYFCIRSFLYSKYLKYDVIV